MSMNDRVMINGSFGCSKHDDGWHPEIVFDLPEGEPIIFTANISYETQEQASDACLILAKGLNNALFMLDKTGQQPDS